MIEKYGKELDMRAMKRDLPKILSMISFTREMAEEHLKDSDGEPVCRICGSVNARPFVTAFGSYKYYECEECGSIFLHNLPNVNELYDTTNSSHDVSANPKVLIDEDTYEQRIKMVAAPKADFILDVLNRNGITIGSWLDIACGGGDMLYHLSKNRNINVKGIEADKAEVEFCKSKGLDVINHYIDVDNMDKIVSDLISENDVVSIMNLIEHVIYPKQFFQILSSKMKEGAIIVLETPRHPSVASFVNLTCPDQAYRHITPPTHLEILSEKGIAVVMGDGFEVLGKWIFGQGYTDLLSSLMLNANLKENDLYVQLMNLSNQVQPVIDANGFGDQMIIVARKKKTEE